jgi:aspartyl-tRNA(Asn)/glutamyl-tRNA(Gln) amidotransferase subunit C
MLEIKDIEKLAKLARIDLGEEQKKSYLKEIGAILNYVDQIKNAVSKLGEERKIPDLRNVARPDENPNQSGSNTETIVSEFPKKEGDYLKVKKIIEQ